MKNDNISTVIGVNSSGGGTGNTSNEAISILCDADTVDKIETEDEKDEWESCRFRGSIVSWNNSKAKYRWVGAAKPSPTAHIDIASDALTKMLKKKCPLLGPNGNEIVPL